MTTIQCDDDDDDDALCLCFSPVERMKEGSSVRKTNAADFTTQHRRLVPSTLIPFFLDCDVVVYLFHFCVCMCYSARGDFFSHFP